MEMEGVQMRLVQLRAGKSSHTCSCTAVRQARVAERKMRPAGGNSDRQQTRTHDSSASMVFLEFRACEFSAGLRRPFWHPWKICKYHLRWRKVPFRSYCWSLDR